jgi:hypothetical protein
MFKFLVELLRPSFKDSVMDKDFYYFKENFSG